MNTEWIGLSILITNVITFFSIIGGVVAIVKYLLELKKEISNVETEMRKEFVKVRTEISDFKVENEKQHSELKIENIKLQSRFDKYDGANTNTEAKITEIKQYQQSIEKQQTEFKQQIVEIKSQITAGENQTTQHLLQVETDNKNFFKEMFQSVQQLLKRPPVL